MIFKSDNVSLTIIQEPYYNIDSIDNLRSYSKEYVLEPKYQPSSIYGLNNDAGSNCVILASGGSSSISKHSAITHDSKVWIGIGDQLVCLNLPNFEMLWHLKIDEATCFGLYISPDGLGLLIHGELSISKVTFLGEVIWATCGKDIYRRGF